MRHRRLTLAKLGSSHRRRDRARIPLRGMLSKKLPGNRREFAMPKINRDGVEIYYEVHGSGPPLLLTHGYSSTSQMWQGQIEALSGPHKPGFWGKPGQPPSDYPRDGSALRGAPP